MHLIATVKGKTCSCIRRRKRSIMLVFLCDVTEELNELNTNLRENDKNLINMTNLSKTFKTKNGHFMSRKRTYWGITK